MSESNTPDVTVNVVASLTDLEDKLKQGDDLIKKWATKDEVEGIGMRSTTPEDAGHQPPRLRGGGDAASGPHHVQ